MVSLNDYWSYRKIDILWRANDPLVNSSDGFPRLLMLVQIEFGRESFPLKAVHVCGFRVSNFTPEPISRPPMSTLWELESVMTISTRSLGMRRPGAGERSCYPRTLVSTRLTGCFRTCVAWGYPESRLVGSGASGDSMANALFEVKNPGTVEVVSINDVTGEAITSGPASFEPGR